MLTSPIARLSKLIVPGYKRAIRMMYKKVIGASLCWNVLITLVASHSVVIARRSASQSELASGNGTAVSRRGNRPPCTAAYLIEPTSSFECSPSSLIMTCRFFAPVNLVGEQVTIKWFFSINMGSLNLLQQSVFNGAANAAYESRIEVRLEYSDTTTLLFKLKIF